MLNKLLRYEFESVGRKLLPLYGALLATAVIAGIVVNINAAITGISMDFLAGLLSAVYGGLMTATYIMLFVVMVTRFKNNLLGDEGYFMLSLPATMKQHLLCKTIAAAIWTFAGMVVATLSILIFGLIGDGANFSMDFGELFRGLGEIGAGVITKFLLIVLAVIVWILSTIVASVLKIYTSIIIAHQVQRCKWLVGFAALIVFSLLESALLNLLIKLNCFNLTDTFGQIVLLILMMSLITLGVAAVYFAITEKMMERKLNLT